MEDILRRLGRRIRELRIARGFKSQESFADYCRMHRTFLGHLETGRKDFRLTTLIRVADALGATLSELFEGLEGGEPLKLRNPRSGVLDQRRLLKELAAVEQGVQKIKEIASSAASRGQPGARKRPSGTKRKRPADD